MGSSKKQYALWYCFMKGKKFDKVKTAGMGAIKSDTPRYSRDFCNQVIEYLLKSYNSYDSTTCDGILMDMYKNAIGKATKLINSGDVTIGRPVSINQSLNTYNSIQSSIRGMIIYELIYGYEFRPGTKGYQFDLKGINFEKLGISAEELKSRFVEKCKKYPWFKKMMSTCKDSLLFGSITVPVDVEHIDTSIFIPDVNSILDSALYNKVKNLYDIVGLTLQKNNVSEVSRKRSMKKALMELNSSSFELLTDNDMLI